MANRLKGEASFRDGEEEFLIRITSAALLETEDRTGVGMLELMAQLDSKLGLIAVLLQMGVLHGSGQDLDRAEALDLIMLNPDARPALFRALEGALPAGGDDPNPPRAAGSGTGKNT